MFEEKSTPQIDYYLFEQKYNHGYYCNQVVLNYNNMKIKSEDLGVFIHDDYVYTVYRFRALINNSPMFVYYYEPLGQNINYENSENSESEYYYSGSRFSYPGNKFIDINKDTCCISLL